jgi:hypothetical protein
MNKEKEKKEKEKEERKENARSINQPTRLLSRHAFHEELIHGVLERVSVNSFQLTLAST